MPLEAPVITHDANIHTRWERGAGREFIIYSIIIYFTIMRCANWYLHEK